MKYSKIGVGYFGTPCIQSNSKDTFVVVEVDLSNSSKTKQVINRHMIDC